MKKSLLALGLSLLLTACGGDKTEETAKPAEKPTTSATENTTPSANPNATSIRVVAAVYPPFVTKDDKGTLTGFDIEILQAIAKLENLNLEIVSRPWSQALESLNTDQSDIVVAAVTLNPERAEQYSPSKPYVSTIRALIVPQDSPIQTINDLKDKVIGVEEGSSFLKEKDKYPTTTFKEFKTSYLALNETLTQKIDGVVAHKLNLQSLLKDKDVKIRFIDIPTAYPDKVIMMKKGNTELTDKINAGLDKIKADGTYDTIYKKWFGEAK